jgi:hypothetical protein
MARGDYIVDWHLCKSVGIRVDPEDLEVLEVFAKEKRVTISHLVKQMFLEGFARWSKGEFNPEITRAAKRRYPASHTAMRAGE